ncbi:hypothetical protein PAECIP111893_02106 [Paenibacillus plantiphilus]|uniref:Uncharacterized protein n=1 Tax=Paenibacillus plantiphilus TaxID=2905650 RepID=A0ABN8GEL3_9BACL|nr:hypothetical protein [Paenibacillus plantiphilus]CAH1203887.1 hypothetical protein PAECIP111893_02106 [Paenibacillus plantiphilus]
MNWESRLAAYCGKMMEVIIEDYAGSDPLAPTSSRQLHHVRLVDERTHLQFYFTEVQFLAIPVFEDDRTRLEESEAGAVFISNDDNAKLIYKMRFSSRE